MLYANERFVAMWMIPQEMMALKNDTLLLQYIDVLFPDQLNFYYQGMLDGIRMSSSTLVVVTPVFLLLSWLVQKELNKEPDKHEIRVRKWLMYLTLFIASITIIIDLVQLVYNFYSGELTTKFLLKVLSVLIVTGAVFFYYLWDLDGQANHLPDKILCPRVRRFRSDCPCGRLFHCRIPSQTTPNPF